MNQRHTEKDNMFEKVKVFLSNPVYTVLWASFARLYDEIKKFSLLKDELTEAIQQHQTNIKGATTDKTVTYDTLVDIAVAKAKKAFVWAIDSKNNTLKEVFNIDGYEFHHKKQSTALIIIKNVFEQIEANIGSMASVALTDADVTEMKAALKSYEDSTGMAGSARVNKQSGTKNIDLLLVSLDNSIEIIDSLLVSHFKQSQPEMVQQYLLNRTIIKLPTHHSSLVLHASDAATAVDIAGAVLSFSGKSSTTDIDGNAEIIKITPVTSTATVVHPDYVQHNEKVVIEKGKMTSIEVKMVRK
jgi:hypothetical protein